VLKKNLKQLKIWADYCPENFECIYKAVLANFYFFCLGKKEEAFILFEAAEQAAKANRYLRYQGVITESVFEALKENQDEDATNSHFAVNI
jgi:hypothetical protein